MPQPPSTYEVVLEVLRIGRRPRYHRAARLDNGELVQPERCNLDQVAARINELDALPEGLRRPWTQLCQRCWRGTEVLAAAERLREARSA